MKNTIIIYLLLISAASYAQDKTTIYVDLKSKYLSSFSINKDTTAASFGIYVRGYECAKKRKKAIRKHTELPERAGFTRPSFTISFMATTKPEVLDSLDSEYKTAKEFSKGSHKTTSIVYIICKSGKGKWLKWKALRIAQE